MGRNVRYPVEKDGVESDSGGQAVQEPLLSAARARQNEEQGDEGDPGQKGQPNLGKARAVRTPLEQGAKSAMIRFFCMRCPNDGIRPPVPVR